MFTLQFRTLDFRSLALGKASFRDSISAVFNFLKLQVALDLSGTVRKFVSNGPVRQSLWDLEIAASHWLTNMIWCNKPCGTTGPSMYREVCTWAGGVGGTS